MNTKFIGQQPSTFAQIMDTLRNKSEAELKMLYLRFFKNDLKNEWKNITKNSSFRKVSEDDIIKAIQKRLLSYHLKLNK